MNAKNVFLLLKNHSIFNEFYRMCKYCSIDSLKNIYFDLVFKDYTELDYSEEEYTSWFKYFCALLGDDGLDILNKLDDTSLLQLNFHESTHKFTMSLVERGAFDEGKFFHMSHTQGTANSVSSHFRVFSNLKENKLILINFSINQLDSLARKFSEDADGLRKLKQELEGCVSKDDIQQ